MDKLKLLLSKCKCGVFLTVNEHRDYYQSAREHLDEQLKVGDVALDVYKEMIKTDTVIQLQFYPFTPIGFYIVWHYDLDLALDEALKALD